MDYLKIFAATIEVFFYGALVSGWSNIGILLRGESSKNVQFCRFFFDEIYPSRPGELYFHATYNSDETVDSTV